MKNQSYVKASLLLFHQKLLSIQNFCDVLKCYLEKLPAWILVILIKNVVKVDFQIAHPQASADLSNKAQIGCGEFCSCARTDCQNQVE